MWISNETEIVESTIIELRSNGRGDAKVTLCVGETADGARFPFLKTNGGSPMVTLEGSSYAASLEASANALAMSAEELRAEIEAAIPGIDW